MPDPFDHHEVIIVGGGPGGLGVAAVLAGWRPWLRAGGPKAIRHSTVEALLAESGGDLFSIDMRRVVGAGLSPFDLFRLLHHPTDKYTGPDGTALEFRRQPPIDWLMLTDEPVGGLWNNVPRNQLTLSPAHWMELAPYPIAQFYRDADRKLDPNSLLMKRDLVDYYHAVPEKLGFAANVKPGFRVTEIRPSNPGEGGRFHVTARALRVPDRNKCDAVRRYTSNHLVYAVGPRSKLRRLNVAGDDLPYVSYHYDHWDDYPGEHTLVVGGGRSADWAATELHDAGRSVTYVMRQDPANHLRLIRDSLHLPYYARIAEILSLDSPRFVVLYLSEIEAFLSGGLIILTGPQGTRRIAVDHAIVEIGGEPDYDLLKDFGPLTLEPKRDRYRFQVCQMAVRPHSFESVDIGGLYPAGYLAHGTGLSVLGMHATAYPIGRDILEIAGLL